MRRWHQLDSPVRWRTHGVLAVASAEIDRRRRSSALPAPQFGEHLGERSVAMVAYEQPNREDRLPPTAVQLKATVRPVGEALAAAEGQRMHRCRLIRERIRNKTNDPLPPTVLTDCVPKSTQCAPLHLAGPFRHALVEAQTKPLQPHSHEDFLGRCVLPRPAQSRQASPGLLGKPDCDGVLPL